MERLILRSTTLLFALLCFAATNNALAQSADASTGQVYAPGDNLVVEGVPPIPQSLVEAVGRYSDFRSALLGGWHPTLHEMLISTRLADTTQAHLLKFPRGSAHPTDLLSGQCVRKRLCAHAPRLHAVYKGQER